MPDSKTVDSLLESLRIPTLPASIQRMSVVLASQNVSMGEIAAALASDPPLTAKALQIANSVHYGLRQKTTSVQMAISVLGLDTLATIVLRAGVISLYSGVKDSPGFRVQDFWRHSVLTAQACEELAKRGRRRGSDLSPQTYYTCGLLHDLGRIALYDALGDEYVRIANAGKFPDIENEMEEARVLGISHADVGAVTAVMWRLPEPIPNVLKDHHRAGVRAADPHIVSIVACADEIANAIVAGPDRDAKALLAAVKTMPAGLDRAALLDAIESSQKSATAVEV